MNVERLLAHSDTVCDDGNPDWMASVIKFRFNFAPAVGEITSLDVFGWHLQVISILYVGGPGASCPVNTTKRSKAVTGWKPTVSQHTHTQLLLSLIILNSIRNSWFLLTFSKIHGAVYRIWAIEIHPVLSVAALVISPSAIRAPLWFFFDGHWTGFASNRT